MSRNRKIKAAVSAAVASCMVAGLAVAPMAGVFTPVAVMAEEGETQSTGTKLDTIWKTVEIGEHEGTGSHVYNEETKTITITGAGSIFDKDSGNDNLSYSYFDVKAGTTTVVAKMTVSGSGFAGIMARNDNEATSQAAAFYADFGKAKYRIGKHGGSSNLADIAGNESVYVKLEIAKDAVYYTVAKDAEFTDILCARGGMGATGLDIRSIGFFATEGATVELSDVNIVSSYTTDEGAVEKVVFDSELGELTPAATTSANYSGKYDAGNSFSTSSNGNVLSFTQVRSAAVKGNIREDVGVDYWVFPETSEDMTITADITVTSLNTGTDKQGIAMGQFSMLAGQAVCCDTLHVQKNKVVQHTFAAAPGSGACGSPNAQGFVIGDTYTFTYTKSNNQAIMKVVAADGTVVLDNADAPIDLTGSGEYEGLQSGKVVNYGFAFTGVTADISNISLLNAANQVVYDSNDYYIAVGVAPVIANPVAAVAEDRESIDLSWDITEEGSGNVKYSVYVAKDGGEFTKVGDSKVNSFSYAAMESDGTYQFKVVPFGGDTAGAESITNAVTYQAPLAQATMTAQGSATQVSLSWSAVEGATSYDVYKAMGSNGTYAVVTTTTQTEYVDTAVEAEEPYYYYVVAKSDNNTSNPCTTMQVLTSNGHTGEYVYENEATKLTVVSKSNDTVFTNAAQLTMTADEAGTARLVVADQEVASQQVAAGAEFTFDMTLVNGRNDVDVLFTDAEGNITRKTFNFVCNPEYDMVVDAAYTGEDGAEVDGHATYKTVQAAVNAVPADNAEAKVIFVKNGEYEERVEVTAPNVSLLGEDAEKTHLFYSVCIANGNANSMWNRNAFYVDSTADGFTAENLTIENSYAYTNGSDQQADALCIVADQTACVNIRLLGYQDTLLTDSRVKDADGNYEVTRQYFEKCYITGNVDFIYGAGTSTFEDCDIVARYTSYKADGCFTAGRTYATTEYGYVFNNCRFLAEEGVGDGTYRMARPWGADDSTTFINCYLGRCISTVEGASYGDMSGNLAENARFAEYGSYGPGYTVNNTRPYLTSAQAEAFQTAIVMGDYDYAGKIAQLYVSEQETPVNPTDPSVDPTDPSVDPTDPSVDPTDPSVDPTDPSVDPTDPSTDPTEPSTDPTDPSTDSTEAPTQGQVAADEADVTTAAPAGNGGEVAADETQTGDSSRAGLYGMLLALTGGLSLAMFGKKKKEEVEEN